MYFIKNLAVSLSRMQILTGVNLSIIPGEYVLIAGPNGSGKSTLLSSITGIFPEYAQSCKITGQILFNKTDISTLSIKKLAGDIGVVLQNPESQISNLTVWEEITFGLGNMLLTREEIRKRAKKILKACNMSHLTNAPVLRLSGGELQRLAIASLVAMQPQALVLDEPLANLDPAGIRLVHNVIDNLHSTGIISTVIVATQLLNSFESRASRIVVLAKGKVVDDFPISKITQKRSLLKKIGILPVSNLHDIPKINKKVYPRAKKTRTLVTAKEIEQKLPDGSTILSLPSLILKSHSRYLLVGPNGSGKTTLGKLLAELIKPTYGEMENSVNNTFLTFQNPIVGFLKSTVKEEVAFGAKIDSSNQKDLMMLFGIWELRTRSPFTLSGGEQKRLSLVTAFANLADLLILDEPTASLDAKYVNILLCHLRNSFKGTAIVISHDQRFLHEASKMQYGLLISNNNSQITQHSEGAQTGKILRRLICN